MIKKIMIEQEDKNKLLNFKFERLNNGMKFVDWKPQVLAMFGRQKCNIKEEVIWVKGNAFIVKKSLKKTKNVIVRSLKKDGVILLLMLSNLIRDIFAHVETIILKQYLI